MKLRQASEIIGNKGYKMRTLQTLDSVAAENSTIVTFPTELVGGMASGENDAPLQEILDNVSDIDLSNFNIGNLEDMSGEDIEKGIDEIKEGLKEE